MTKEVGTYNFFMSLFFFSTQTYSCTRTASSLEAEAGAVGGNGLDSQLYKRVDSIHDTFTTEALAHFLSSTPMPKHRKTHNESNCGFLQSGF